MNEWVNDLFLISKIIPIAGIFYPLIQCICRVLCSFETTWDVVRLSGSEYIFAYLQRDESQFESQLCQYYPCDLRQVMWSFQALVPVFNMTMTGILTVLVSQWSLFLMFNFLRSPYWKWIGLIYTTNKILLKRWGVILEHAIKDTADSSLEACSLLDQSVWRKPAITSWGCSSRRQGDVASCQQPAC